MTFLRLLLRNLVYHWRGNLAVFLGITLGAAVLTGALLVGDSLRGSLQALTLDQLGWVEQAMLPGRFFRAGLADDVAAERRTAVLLLQGSITRKTGKDDETLRVGKVTFLGVDASFWPSDAQPEGANFWTGEEREAVLNQTLARDLGAQVGDKVTLQVPKAETAPAEHLLGKRKPEDVIETLSVVVKRIVPDEGMGRFSLKPTPEPVRNAFVPIRLLQKRLDLAGRANAILVGQATSQTELHRLLTLDDWGLQVRSPKERAEALVKLLDPRDLDEGKLKKLRWRDRVPENLARAAEQNGGILTREQIEQHYKERRGYWLIESRRMLIEPIAANAAHEVGLRKEVDQWIKPKPAAPLPGDHPQLHRERLWHVAPVLVGLADSISDGVGEVPYAIVAGIDTKQMSFQPLGDDDIVLVDWPGSPLQAKAGQWITITYYTPDERNHLVKKERKFKVQEVASIKSWLDDPDFTPPFPGITDKLDMASWENPPFPYHPKRIKKADEDFWKRYRTTPRAYVSLKVAQEIWGTRFGNLTSLRVNGDIEQFTAALLARLEPEKGGFVFQPVRAQAVAASTGATDFGGLFLAFSFFLIVSALLLVGLLVRLNIDRRAAEVGLLLATGWSHRQVRWLLLGEGACLALVGTAVGLGGALLYASLMLRLLAARWPGGESLNFMRLHATPTSFAIGFVASLVVSVLTLVWATRVLSKLSPRSLLSGDSGATAVADRKPGWSWWLVPLGVSGAILLVVAAPFFSSHAAQAGSFFGSGALLLIAALAAVWNRLKRTGQVSSPQPSLARLGVRNAGRNAVRSVLTVGLLASASFLIVAVESFHKNTDRHFLDKTGGSGGFAFFAEGSVPVFEDLNQPRVREDHALDVPELKYVKFYPCRVQPGDDASCLNLYKPLKPRVLGVPHTLIERGGFHFAATGGADNPWTLLRTPVADGEAIPAIIDANTAQWILKVGVGDTIEVNNDQGQPVLLRVVALLKESIFQSEVLVADEHFRRLYPRQTGFSFLLIEANDTNPATLKVMASRLQKGLDDFNLDVQTTASRLEGYLAVENMYLATFQALGGLGLLLGAVGLAIVLLRGVWERRAELALLQALGFRSGQLAWLVLVENAYLLLLGLVAGAVSALLAVAPHLIGTGAPVLWLRIGSLLAGVLVVGLVAAVLAVWSAARTPVLTALRRE